MSASTNPKSTTIYIDETARKANPSQNLWSSMGLGAQGKTRAPVLDKVGSSSPTATELCQAAERSRAPAISAPWFECYLYGWSPILGVLRSILRFRILFWLHCAHNPGISGNITSTKISLQSHFFSHHSVTGLRWSQDLLAMPFHTLLPPHHFQLRALKP